MQAIARNQARPARSGRSEGGRFGWASAFPFWGWSALYYLVLLFVYRYIIHGYITGILDRQLVGFGDTLALTATLAGYILLCVVPAFIWSRRSFYHPVWRGIESFICYVAVALVMGAIFAAFAGEEWSVLSGISAGGSAWAGIGSVGLLLAAFIGASWLGGMKDSKRSRRSKNRKREKKEA